MSAKQKRKAKPRVTRKETPRPIRKRKAPEEKVKEAAIAPGKRAERRIAEPLEEKPFFLAVRLQGPFAVPRDIESALGSLRLKRRFSAVLLEKNGSILGTLRFVKDYITWGEVKSHEIAALLKERGELSNGMHVSDKFVKDNFGTQSVEELATALARGQVQLKSLWHKGVRPVFRLRPPSGGFDSSIKRPYGSQGELGDRGEGIRVLLARMT